MTEIESRGMEEKAKGAPDLTARLEVLSVLEEL